LFRIVSEAGIAAGIRRIEAVTGGAALALIREDQQDLISAAKTLKVSRRELVSKVQQLVTENKDLSRQLEQIGQQLAASKGTDLINQAVKVSGVSILAAQVEGDNKSMMQVLESLLAKIQGDVLVILAVVDKGKVGLAAATNKALSQRLSAAELLQSVAPLVGAKGGGRPDLARAGGGDKAEAVEQALAAAREWVEGKLAS
jgi:alanyl-tRNA synthetase